MTFPPTSDSRPLLESRPTAAFTLPEIMIVMGIFSLLIIAGLYSHLLGLKMNSFMETKLKATHNARAALNTTRDEIRSAQTLYVGYGGPLGFTNVADNFPQRGNAVQVYATTNTNSYVRFYVDTNKSTFNRLSVTPSRTNLQILANYVTNVVPFHVEYSAGTP